VRSIEEEEMKESEDEFRCGKCDSVFKTKKELEEHNKKAH